MITNDIKKNKEDNNENNSTLLFIKVEKIINIKIIPKNIKAKSITN